MISPLKSELLRRLAGTALAILAVTLIGTAGYWMLRENNESLLDCLYMTVITITTIGYGEVVDLTTSPEGRIFTMLIALTGIGVLTYLLSSFTAFIVEGELRESFRRRKMEKLAAQLEGHYIICGAGRVGHHIAEELLATQRQCVVIDTQEESLESFAQEHAGLIYLVADASDNESLVAANIEKAAGLFAATEEDHKNLVIALSAKQLNPNVKVIARCSDMKNQSKMQAAGADSVITPSLIGGLRMASVMVRPEAVSFLDVMLRDKKRNLRVESIRAALPGKTVHDLRLDKFPQTLLLAIDHPSGWTFNPPSRHELDEDSTLVVMTESDERKDLEQHLAALA